MKIRAIDAELDQWIARRVTPPRTKGQHVSEIVTDMLKSLQVKRYESWGKNKGDERHPMYEAGYAWEDVMAKMLSERPVSGQWAIESCELELDGIYGTPDRLIAEPDGSADPTFDDYRLVDEELKFTWMSCKPLLIPELLAKDTARRPEKPEDWIAEGLIDDAKFSYWLLQAKTYAAMLWLKRMRPYAHASHSKLLLRSEMDFDPPLTPLTRLRALFINGAYRDELAIPGAFEIEWTPEELTAWWANVKGHAATMRMRESTTPAF
jgi:hypothetical protein